MCFRKRIFSRSFKYFGRCSNDAEDAEENHQVHEFMTTAGIKPEVEERKNLKKSMLSNLLNKF